MEGLALLIFDNLLFISLRQALVAKYHRGMEGHFSVRTLALLRRGCVNDLQQVSSIDFLVYDLI
jgi:hypothetical protein